MRIAIEANVAGSKGSYWWHKPHNCASKPAIHLCRTNEWTWSDHQTLTVILDCCTQTLNGAGHEQSVAGTQRMVDATFTACDSSQNQPSIRE
jgi:hypothetical protein